MPIVRLQAHRAEVAEIMPVVVVVVVRIEAGATTTAIAKVAAARAVPLKLLPGRPVKGKPMSLGFLAHRGASVVE